MKSDTPLKLGDFARDVITGLQGIVVCEARWLNGCVRLTLQPKEIKDGKPVDMSTFDVEQLELVAAEALPVGEPSGGPADQPARLPDPVR